MGHREQDRTGGGGGQGQDRTQGAGQDRGLVPWSQQPGSKGLVVRREVRAAHPRRQFNERQQSVDVVRVGGRQYARSLQPTGGREVPGSMNSQWQAVSSHWQPAASSSQRQSAVAEVGSQHPAVSS